MQRLALLLAVSSALVVPSAAQAAPASVEIGDFFFRPDYARIEPGDTVTWTMLDGSPHTVTSEPSAPAPFDSGELLSGQTFAFTFAAAGRYAYICDIHPFMKGVVQVGPDTVDPVLSKVRAKLGERRVRVTFGLSETSRVSAKLVATRRPGKVLRRMRARKLENGRRVISLRRQGLAAGRYRIRLTAKDPEGNIGTARATFRIAR
jgi:plastocyanin